MLRLLVFKMLQMWQEIQV